MVRMTTYFEGLTASLEVSEERNSFGQYPATLRWGELDIFCTFPTMEAAEDFMMDKDSVSRMIDHAAHDAAAASYYDNV